MMIDYLRLAGNIILVISVFIPVIVVEYAITPPKTGFHCNDDYNLPRKPDIVSDTTLVLVFVVSPFLILLIMEAIHFVRKADRLVNPMPKTRQICGRNCVTNPKFQSNLKIFSAYIYGFGATLLVTDVGKYGLGQLRPHFFTVCKPDWSKIDCTKNEYITNYTCTDKSRVPQVYLSFPSGHSALSCYGMVFLVIYFQYRFIIKRPFLLRPFIQTVAIIGAFFTSASRVIDNNHFWRDVIAGAVIGSFFACLMLFASLEKKDLHTRGDIKNERVQQKDSSMHLMESNGLNAPYDVTSYDMKNDNQMC